MACAALLRSCRMVAHDHVARTVHLTCSNAMARVVRRIAVALLALFALAARAEESDWIDELPTVTAVAHAVAEQLKVDFAGWRFDAGGITFTVENDKEEFFALYVVNTLVLLRQIILYKYQEEKSLWEEEEASEDEAELEEEPLSPETKAKLEARKGKLRCMVATYLEAELLIGKGVGKRLSSKAAGASCRDDECYRRWFKLGVGSPGASYRARFLPRLFPRRRLGRRLDRLAQSYAVRALTCRRLP